MIVSLDRLTDAEIRRAVDRGKDYLPEDIEIVERGDGFVRADVACNGTCGARAFHDGKHDVVLWWNRIATCSCPAVHGCCKHIAALWAHEGGVIPDKPKDCEAYRCGGQLMYWNGGNGHAAQCPRVNDPEDVYQAPVVAREERPARKVVPMSQGRQRTIDKTRPVLTITGTHAWVVRGCGHKVLRIPLETPNTITLPLSPFEGCPECNDSMQPPAPDQVRAREEVR